MIDMTPSLTLVATAVVVITAGVYLLLERSLTRVLLGVVLVSNGINMMFLVASGAAGGAPIIGATPVDQMSDPLPQALTLTVIVITLGISAFLATMAYRSWQLNQHDEVQDDLEDRRIAARAAGDRAAYADLDLGSEVPLEEEAADVRDETEQSGRGATAADEADGGGR